ncbi:putative acetate transporter [Galdieria sulphuraria]|uniref:Putative acetate transporter n=1 Tax=Galdieria sulphuraria TaxID=130081 RepID=M2Y9A3_GALSU|nr:putative acetate transporter [Galdieria sulphuraria]EME32673.1 putative acetate transporter [Galdieria sulphuraria]|eukprot:XP_005709193.1 putative acetate transporter [Galdieria sulphuraria]
MRVRMDFGSNLNDNTNNDTSLRSTDNNARASLEELVEKDIERKFFRWANMNATESTPKNFPFPDPTSLGLAGFSATTFILSIFNAKLLPDSVTSGVIGPGFFYGGAAQFIAGLMCFVTRNSFGFVALTSYGAFWLAVSTLITLQKENVLVFTEEESNRVLGILLVSYAIFSLYLWIGSFAHSLALIIITSLLETTLILLSLANLGVISSIPGGVTGIMLASAGWYMSAAIFINENFRRTVIPLGEVQNIPLLRQFAPYPKKETN